MLLTILLVVLIGVILTGGIGAYRGSIDPLILLLIVVLLILIFGCGHLGGYY